MTTDPPTAPTSDHAGAAILDDLARRGLCQDSTDEAALREHLAQGPVTLYHGIDPTADSLHVGNLIGVLVLRRFQDHGHVPLALVGGATGMVGDPSGRSDERNLLDADTLARNLEGIGRQLGGILDLDERSMVDNLEWTASLTLIDFLRDVGKHATVNQMVAKESVRARMAGESGISFTEFTYMLLQANDFWQLNQDRGCTLQIGGSDQWGNITAGIDLIRRRSGRAAHGLTWPLLTRSDGQKFGKSAEGNVWLAPERTSPYAFYQHWIRTPDDDVERFLLQLTLLPVDEVTAVAERHRAAPGEREAQRRLAREMTTMIHGPDACDAAEEAAQLLFGRDVARPERGAIELLEAELPVSTLPRSAVEQGIDVVELLTRTGICASKGAARRSLKGNAVRLNGVRAGEESVLGPADLWYDQHVLVRNGKAHHLVRVGE